MGFVKHTYIDGESAVKCTPSFPDWILTKGIDVYNGEVFEIAFGECAVLANGTDAVDVCFDIGSYIYETDDAELSLYFVNMKEQNGGAFSVPDIRFIDDAGKDIRIDCDGRFNFAVADPKMFFGSLWAYLSDCVRYDDIAETVKDEVKEAMQPAFNKLAVKGIHQLNLSEHTPELISAVRGSLSLEWDMMRGIELRYLSVSTMEKIDFGEVKLGSMFDDLGSNAASDGDSDSDDGTEKSTVNDAGEQIVNGFANLFGALFKEVGESMMGMSQTGSDSSDDNKAE